MQLKQKTVRVGNKSEKIYLKRLKNPMNRGGKWMYVVEDKDGSRFGDPFTSKREAKSEFHTIAEQIERGMEDEMGSSQGLDLGLSDDIIPDDGFL